MIMLSLYTMTCEGAHIRVQDANRRFRTEMVMLSSYTMTCQGPHFRVQDVNRKFRKVIAVLSSHTMTCQGLAQSKMTITLMHRQVYEFANDLGDASVIRGRTHRLGGCIMCALPHALLLYIYAFLCGGLTYRLGKHFVRLFITRTSRTCMLSPGNTDILTKRFYVRQLHTFLRTRVHVYARICAQTR